MENKQKKFSYRWTDRALRLMENIDSLCANFDEPVPAEISTAAFDAIQHFVWATDCRRQAYNTTYRDGPRIAWGPKADKAHRAGKKDFAIAQKWLDEYRALKFPTKEAP